MIRLGPTNFTLRYDILLHHLITKTLQVLSVKNFVTLRSFIGVLFDELPFHFTEIKRAEISEILKTFYIVLIQHVF